jgi:hypothetical protein
MYTIHSLAIDILNLKNKPLELAHREECFTVVLPYRFLYKAEKEVLRLAKENNIKDVKIVYGIEPTTGRECYTIRKFNIVIAQLLSDTHPTPFIGKVTYYLYCRRDWLHT